ncbi:cysteine desulfurase family protein [Ignavigranum ruoffiae]|uniref:cysteine desulfurase family protein n=1 Tax=Ignavigranum ruoffiae TaxID=89093 RepID=UPI0024AD4D3A|nr:cysteine desulfurase family protein [Ignavigranum ruoffiae]
MYYFDNSATTQPLEEVLTTYQKVAERYFANPSSAHRLGEEAKALLNQARQQIADILAFKEDEIYFTASGSEANNWFLRAVVPALKERRSMNQAKVLISAIEHPSMLRQLDILSDFACQFELIPVDDQGQIDLIALEEALKDDHVLAVSTMAVNNEVGSRQPLTKIGQILNKYPQIIWHVDAVQAVTACLNDLNHPRIDCLSLSSHKFYAVRGVGIFAKRQRVASQPMIYGGGQERSLRSGTENLAGIVATAKALRLAAERQGQTQAKLSNFRQQIIEQFETCGWHVFAKKQASPHIICAALPPIPGEVLLHAFEQADIFISTTSACSSRQHRAHASLTAMGVPAEISNSAVRLSMSQYTTEDELNYVLGQIPKISQAFQA